MSGSALQIRLVNELSEIPRVAELVERFLAEAGADGGVIFKVSLCLDELLTNVISYGFAEPGRHEIEVRMSVADGSVRIDLEDDGRPFNPLDNPPPDLDSGLEEREVGGLGIHFVRASMDRVAYRRAGNRNLLSLQRALRDDGRRGGE